MSKTAIKPNHYSVRIYTASVSERKMNTRMLIVKRKK